MSNKLRQARHRRTLAFFEWALADGRHATEKLGSVPLTPTVSAKVRAELAHRAKGS